MPCAAVPIKVFLADDSDLICDRVAAMLGDAGMSVVGFAAMTPAARLQDAGAHAVVSSMIELAQAIRSTTP